MPGINERVNKSKGGREGEAGRKETEREGDEEGCRGEIESEGERAGRRREHGDQSAAVYPLFAGVR